MSFQVGLFDFFLIRYFTMPNLINRKQPVQPTYAKVLEQTTHTGTPIHLTLIHHDDAQCKEFIVASPDFPFKKWLLWTTVLNVLGYSVNLHLQDERLMSCTVVLLLLALFIKMHYKVKKESLLVMKSVGVQHTTTFASGRQICLFYDIQQIKDIIINEGVTMWKVIYYLSLLLCDNKSSSDTPRLVPLFTQSWPSLSCLKKIYNGATNILFSQPKHSSVFTKLRTR